MSRYDNREKDDLYDEIYYGCERALDVLPIDTVLEILLDALRDILIYLLPNARANNKGE